MPAAVLDQRQSPEIRSVLNMRCVSWLKLPLAVAAASIALVAPIHAAPVEGRDYAKLAAPQPQEAQGRIEVIEFFSYGCPHCDHLHPLISKWAAQLPANVTFIRVPVSLGRPQWGQLVRAYYALQATGDLARLDTPLFDAIHRQKLPLFNQANITSWVIEQGVDADRFTAAYNSFNVSTRATHAEQLSREYQIEGIPAIYVAGRYHVLGNDYPTMLTNATQVIEMVSAGK